MDRIENLENRIEKLEETVEFLKKDLKIKVEGKTTSKLEKLITQNILKLKPQDLVILILFSKAKMTKDEIKNEFQSLGATNKMLNWFSGGNFKQRLVDAGIVFEDGKKENKSMFSLTKGKGKQFAEEIIYYRVDITNLDQPDPG